MAITIHQGSILDSTADCIVNPANSFLRHGGGLAAIIDRAALTWQGRDYRNIRIADAMGRDRNPELQRMWEYKNAHEKASLIATGNACWTPAGMLPFKGIVHAVGPIWNDGSFLECDLLELAVESACEVALKAGCNSIAFPAISCGIFGFPVERAARIHVEVGRWYADTDRLEVEFWPFGFEAEFEAELTSANESV